MKIPKQSWAEVVSNVVSPPLVWGLLAFPIAARDARAVDQAIVWALIYIFFFSIVPILYISLQVHRGIITDMHMPMREERIRPFLVSLLSGSLGAIILSRLDISTLMHVYIATTLLQLALMGLITTFWQISAHAISISGATVIVAVIFGPLPAFILSPLIPLVAVARLNLYRHTRTQVIAGIAVGVLCIGGFLWAVGMLEPNIWARL
jgi:hypothetical protein